MMDPLSCLGLVSNIVQLISAAVDAFSLCHQVYTLGASIEDSQMGYTSEQLHQCYSALDNSLQRNAASGLKALSSGVDLGDLVLQCCETAKELQTELQSLRTSSNRGFRETALKVLSKKRKAKKINKLKSRLDEYQRVLDSKVLIDIRQWLCTLETHFEGQHSKFEQQLSQISANLTTCHIPFSNQLKSELAKAIKANEEQHVLTRQHAETRIVSAVQGLEISQDKHRSEEKEEHLYQQQYEQFLVSLTFDEINLRMNEVSPSHPQTFEWIFDDDIERPWDSFVKWLQGDDCIYWIQGKAGSGKSTLMKYLADDPRTMSLLAQWSPNSEVLVVKHFFWLSGRKMQRSLKGLLCSVARYIVLGDKRLVEKAIARDETLLMKRSIHDWSGAELQQLLRLFLDLMTRSICFFIDGLDEFDQGDDIEYLLSFIEDLSKADRIKICISSRPENYIVKRMSQYSKMRLQDLTASDMQICIRDELKRVLKTYPRASLGKTEFNRIVNVVIEKADGVFLWVYYTLSSLCRGMRNEDDFNNLLERIEELPNEMQQLYLQMWKRLNKDEQRYRAEATTYFSYTPFFPISLFEMLVALNKALQETYVRGLAPQDPDDIARDCKRLETRIFSRCAGLLIVETEKDEDIELGSEERQDVNKHRVYYKTKIRLLHRTARDFLENTKEGQNLLGFSETTLDSRFQHVIRAEMATLIQGIILIDLGWVYKIMRKIGDFGTEGEKELLIDVRRVSQRLSKEGLHEHHIGYRKFWYTYERDHYPWDFMDFESAAAYAGCADYVRHYIENAKHYISAYYRGFLVLCAARTLFYWKTKHKLLALISWLVQEKADIYTRQRFDEKVTHVPAPAVLCSLLDFEILEDKHLAKQAAEIIQLILPLLATSRGQYKVRLSRSNNWLVNNLSSVWNNTLDEGRSWLLVQMKPIKLGLLVMQRFEEESVFKPHFSRPAITTDDTTTEVLFYLKYKNHKFKRFCPNCEDKIYLGQSLERIWFRDETSSESLSSLIEDLDTQLEKMAQRSKKSTSRRGYPFILGQKLKARKNALHGLDPTEDVDESNWFRTGHFRARKRSVPEGHTAKRHRSIVDDNGDFVLVECSESEYSDESSESEHSGEWGGLSVDEASGEDSGKGSSEDDTYENDLGEDEDDELSFEGE